MSENNFNQNGFNNQTYGGFDNAQSQEYYQRLNQYRLKALSEKKSIRKYGNAIGLAMTANIIIQVVSVFVLSLAGLYDVYQSSLVFYSSFNIIFVSFLGVAVPFGIVALVFKKDYQGDIVPAKKLGAKRGFFWVCFGLGCAIAANFLVSYIINICKYLGYELTQGNSPKINSILACVISVIGTAIIPAICEEFAMRCCSLQLLKKYGKAFGVISISIVFGILHGNVIQFIFAFLVGLVLAYITVKTDNIIPAMIVHGINNSLSVISDISTYASGQKLANTLTFVFYAVFAILGIISLVYLAIKGEFKKDKEVKDFSPYSLSTAKKIGTFLFVPGMIFPFSILIYLTIKTIIKI